MPSFPAAVSHSERLYSITKQTQPLSPFSSPQIQQEENVSGAMAGKETFEGDSTKSPNDTEVRCFEGRCGVTYQPLLTRRRRLLGHPS